MAVAALVLHTAQPPGDARDPDDGAGRFASGDGRQDDFIARPGDACAFALVELPRAPVRDAVQSSDGINDLGKIRGEQFIDLQLGLDGVEHFQRRRLRRADQDHESAVTIEHRPEACGFGQTTLSRTSRHGQSEQSAGENGGFDFLNRLQVILGPAQRIGVVKVSFAEQFKVPLARFFPFQVRHLRQVADVAAGQGLFGGAVACSFTDVIISTHFALCRRSVMLIHQPRDIFDQIDASAVGIRPDAKADPVELPINSRLGEHEALFGGVQQTCDFDRAHGGGVNCHRRSSWQARRRK